MMKIIRLTRAEKQAAVKVLALAFKDYPVMHYVLDHTETTYEKALRALVGFFCETRLTRDYPLLGLRERGEIRAVAGVNNPGSKPWPEELHKIYQELRRVIGDVAIKRLEHYERASDALAPKEPHYFLGIIGVHPSYQNWGYGGALIRHIKLLASKDKFASGIVLNTENPENVGFYRNLGFEIVGECRINDLHSWCMQWKHTT